MSHWYVLFIKTGSEYAIEKILKNNLDSELFSPFIPLLETIFHGCGKTKKEINPMFPGYIFIDSEIEGREFIQEINRAKIRNNNIYKVLSYSDDYFPIREEEKLGLLSLCDDEYCMKASSGIIVGDKIIVNSGPLQGRESIIKRIDRHKRKAVIEINILGDKRLVSVGLEIVKRI